MKRHDAILDRFNALRVLRADEETQGNVLEEIAELGAPEHDIAEDDSYTLALLAIVLLLVAWIVVPLVVWLFFG